MATTATGRGGAGSAWAARASRTLRASTGPRARCRPSGLLERWRQRRPGGAARRPPGRLGIRAHRGPRRARGGGRGHPLRHAGSHPSRTDQDRIEKPEEKSAMIHLEQVTKKYRTERVETTALDNINLAIGKGEFVSIMGPSGCGKSTLLNLMGLLDEPSAGKVALDGKSIDRYGDRDLARVRNERLGFVFQQFHLVADLSVVDNVEIPLLYRKMTNKERRRAALAALDRVGLASRTQHFPGQLSGGQQQRVAIARAIVGNPSVLLADEPTGNLDSQMGDEIMGILPGPKPAAGTTIVMVTHDPRLADRTHRVVRLFDGRQVQ